MDKVLNPVNQAAYAAVALCSTGEPVINIKGEKIGLGPMVREDSPVYRRWLNNFDTLRSGGVVRRVRVIEYAARGPDRNITH